MSELLYLIVPIVVVVLIGTVLARHESKPTSISTSVDSFTNARRALSKRRVEDPNERAQ